MDSRRALRYPDSHQLFVGNLPHDIDEGELKDFFMSESRPCGTFMCGRALVTGRVPPTAFGNVVELRINTKGVGGKLPNFGFVVFDDSEPVQRILAAKVGAEATAALSPASSSAARDPAAEVGLTVCPLHSPSCSAGRCA